MKKSEKGASDEWHQNRRNPLCGQRFLQFFARPIHEPIVLGPTFLGPGPEKGSGVFALDRR